MNKIAKPRIHNRETAPDRSLHRPALTRESVRLARIRRKAPQARTNAELAYEEGAELAVAYPDERPAIIAGALTGLGLGSVFILIAGRDERGRYRFACAVSDWTAYFGGKG